MSDAAKILRDLDKLQAEAEKLMQLLKDRQVGLTSWWVLLRERLDALDDVADGMGR